MAEVYGNLVIVVILVMEGGHCPQKKVSDDADKHQVGMHLN